MSTFWTFDGIDDDRIALLGPGPDPASLTMTYGALSRAADRWAARLREAAGDLVPLVALELATSHDAIAAYLGALRAGFPLLIVEPGKGGPDSPLVRAWRPDITLTADTRALIALSERTGWREDVASLPTPHPDLGILLSTSGSTGEPKLVRLSARNIAANADSIAEYLDIHPCDRAATTLPLFYSYGLSVLNSYLSVGAGLVVTRSSVTDPEFWGNARTSGVTSLALVPHQFDLLRVAGFDGAELPTLRYVTQAGGRLDPGTMEHFWRLGRTAGWQLFIMYGQTEAGPRISYVPPDALPSAGHTIGRAVPGGRLWLVDDAGREISEPGIAGELVYAGPNVMMGYATTRPDLAKDAELTELRTGDVAERTPEGYVRLVGRMKRFVKLYGLRLSLDQIEASLRSQGRVVHAVGTDEHLVLLCRDARDEEAVRKVVADAYGLPAGAVHTAFLAETPLLPSGKVDDRALQRVASDAVARSAATRVMTPRTSLLELMALATRASEVRPTDTFVGLGGDSLSYLEVQIALDERLGEAPCGWERMTIAELVALEAQPAEGDRRRRRGVPVGIDVVLRVVAIALIVVQHATTYPVFGGAWVLLAVMGFSAARLRAEQIAAGRSSALLRMLYPIVPLYFAILLVYALFRDDVPLSYWLLVGNYEPWTGGSLLVVYWFVSVYAQIVVVLAVVAALAPARRIVTSDPWRAATLAAGPLLVVLVLLAALDGPDGPAYVSQRGLAECLSVFVIGWMLQRMKGSHQVVVTVVLAVAVLALLDMTPRVLVLVVAALTLLGLDVHLRAPGGWARVINQVASTTLFVYLVHEVVVFGLERLGMPEALDALLALTLSLALAAALKRAFDEVDRAVVGRRRSTTSVDGVVL